MQLRLLAQTLGAAPEALLRPHRQLPALPAARGRAARAAETARRRPPPEGARGGEAKAEEEEEGAAEGLHSREALEERIRSVRQQFSDIRQQAAVRAR